jgi:hypothetical protein
MAFVEALQDSQYLLQVTYPQLCMRIPWVQGADGDSAEEADDMTCAVCLERTPLIEIALVKGCEHQYCGECPTPAQNCWMQHQTCIVASDSLWTLCRRVVQC